jgi:hypothetical protein
MKLWEGPVPPTDLGELGELIAPPRRACPAAGRSIKAAASMAAAKIVTLCLNVPAIRQIPSIYIIRVFQQTGERFSERSACRPDSNRPFPFAVSVSVSAETMLPRGYGRPADGSSPLHVAD